MCVCTHMYECNGILPRGTWLWAKVLGKIERYYLFLKPYNIKIKQETKKIGEDIQGNMR